ncbi:MAG: Fic family protein [Bacilli bacterium]|nr:Fic family protein [Bacilli bacterium]
MIKVSLNNDLLTCLIEIEKNKIILENTKVPVELSNKFRKNTRKRSSYASTAIEGNPLSYEQAEIAIESKNRHFLKLEQEVRNYYIALEFLSKKLDERIPYSTELLLKVQKQIVLGESEDKVGLRGPMPPGVLFAVYDSKTGKAEYIPPEYSNVPNLLKELEGYINTSDDHPIIKAAILHYQLVTIHPFEDGNGRCARIMSNYVLSYYGYGFKEIGSLEEYFAYDLEEYYASLQMGLPVLYYEGRDNPPHPEIWINYFMRIFSLYANKVTTIATTSITDNEKERFNHLSTKAKKLLDYLKKERLLEFAPIEMAKVFDVSNRTIINWCVELCENGYLKPNIVNKRIRTYSLL